MPAEAKKVRREDDPKLATVVDELVAIAEEAAQEGIGETDTRDRRKVLIFSYFADTVDWVVEHLDAITQTDPRLVPYRGRVVAISGTHGRKDDVLWGFAPRTTDAPPGRDQDRFDIVVTTDVLAEGVNLQQARHILNYDLPWNPMRLVQRHGRIDRIGSPHTEVVLRCIFPDRQLDDLLGLETRLEWKIKQAAASVGVGGEVLPGSRVEDVTFTETREEIERLRAGDATLFEEGGAKTGALSGEEYRQELRLAFENPDLLERIQGLPWGSGSGMARPGASPGYVFCARVADHPQVQFRYVDMTDPLAPAVVEDTLACLAHARPPDELDTPRVLKEATYQGAFDAWPHARDAIVAAWNRSSDPANLAPPVPPAMQRAAELVRRHRPASMTLEEADRLIDVLEAPYPERTLRAIRQAIASSEDPQQQVLTVAQTTRDLGLQPNQPPKPLPEIEHDDVHLVCWIAIVPPAPPSYW